MLPPLSVADESDGRPPHTLQAPLEKALAESRAQTQGGLETDAVQTLNEAIQRALAELDPQSDAAQSLTSAVQSVKGLDKAKSVVRTLRNAIEDALVALDYEPTSSADLPAGFPPLGKVGVVEIKKYPAYRGAWTSMRGKLAAGPNRLFWPLFQHIEKNEVAMTAPVEMRFPTDFDGENATEGEMSMAFLYGNPTLGEVGPDGPVTVRDEPPLTVVSVGLRGPYNARSMAAGVEQLRAWLAAHQSEYIAEGPPRRLAYNGPDVPARRLFSEVQIPVRPANEPSADK